MDDPMDGTVYDLDGRRLGRSADIEGEFIAAVHEAQRDANVVVVTSPHVPIGFVQRLQRECEVDVEIDGNLDPGVTLIVER